MSVRQRDPADGRRDEEGVHRLRLRAGPLRDRGHLAGDLGQRAGQRRRLAGEEGAGPVGGQLAVAREQLGSAGS